MMRLPGATPAMRGRPVHVATTEPVPSLIVASSDGEPARGTMRSDTIWPTDFDSTRGSNAPIGVTSGIAEQNVRSRSSSSSSIGAVNRRNTFLSAMSAACSVEIAPHDHTDHGAFFCRLNINLINERADQRDAGAAFKHHPFGIFDRRRVGQPHRIEAFAAVFDHDLEHVVALGAADEHPLVAVGGAVRLDGVGAGL